MKKCKMGNIFVENRKIKKKAWHLRNQKQIVIILNFTGVTVNDFRVSQKITCISRGVESFSISTINFSIHGSNKRFFDKLYEGSRAESGICC